jgi:hypothetical protein
MQQNAAQPQVRGSYGFCAIAKYDLNLGLLLVG